MTPDGSPRVHVQASKATSNVTRRPFCQIGGQKGHREAGSRGRIWEGPSFRLQDGGFRFKVVGFTLRGVSSGVFRWYGLGFGFTGLDFKGKSSKGSRVRVEGVRP